MIIDSIFGIPLDLLLLMLLCTLYLAYGDVYADCDEYRADLPNRNLGFTAYRVGCRGRRIVGKDIPRGRFALRHLAENRLGFKGGF